MIIPPSLIGNDKTSNIQFNNSHSFDIKTNENLFKLKISYNDELLFFEVNKIYEFPKNNYNISLNLEDLGKINKFFIQFEYPSEVVNSLALIIKNNNLSIIGEDKQMKIQIINPLNKKNIYINVPLKEKDLKSEIDCIILEFTYLIDKVKDLDNKIKVLEKQNN